jgi:hypothetical protein
VKHTHAINTPLNQLSMTINYIGLVIIIIGGFSLLMAIVQPKISLYIKV